MNNKYLETFGSKERFHKNPVNAVELEVGVHLLVGWVALEGGQGEGLQVVAQEVVQMEDHLSILLVVICLALMVAQPVPY